MPPLLIYACALADFAAIDRDRFEVVAVTGNSIGLVSRARLCGRGGSMQARGWSTAWAG